MTDIINLILVIVALIFLLRFNMWFWRRVRLIVKLGELKKMCDARITYVRFPFLPNKLQSEKPDIIVEILDTVYLIRLYSGGGTTKFVHFVSPKFSVRYTKVRTGRFVIQGRIRSRFITFADSAFNVGTKVFVHKELKDPDDFNHYERKVERVILFNPAPNEVSYVTKEKTSIKTAYTGDEMYGFKIFTASSFVAHADRATRKNDTMRYF